MKWRVWIEEEDGSFRIRCRSSKGKNLPSKHASTKTLANRVKKKWEEELEYRRLGLTNPNKSVQEAYDEYLEQIQKTLAENTVLTVKRIIPKYLQDKTIVMDLSRQSIVDWRAKLFKVHKPRTIKNHLRHLSAWLSWLVDEGYLDDSPFKRIKVPNPEPELRQMYDDELVALDNAATGDLKIMFRIAWTTGMRQANTLALQGEWRQGDVFLVPRTKNRRPQAFPIDADRVAPLLARKPKQGPLFPGWDRYRLKREFNALKRAAGVRMAITWHFAKHTFIKMALLSGLSKPEAQQLAGNLSSQSMDHYTVFEQSGLKARHGEIQFPKVRGNGGAVSKKI